MTLGIAFVTETIAGVVTDRRLSGGGLPSAEDADKSGLVVLRDGRFAYSFAGLAQAGSFQAITWLAQKFMECAAGGAGLDQTLAKLAEALTSRFRVLPLSVKEADKQFILLVVGFRLSPLGIKTSAIRVVSNQADSSIFTVEGEDVPAGEGRMMAIGSGARRAHASADKLLSALQDPGLPVTALAERAVDVIRAVADSEPGGAVGDWCSSIVIGSSLSGAALFDYYPGLAATTARLPAFTYARWDGYGAFAVAISAVDLSSDGNSTFARVGRRRRDGLCSCGSGRRYKRCHGRTAPGPASASDSTVRFRQMVVVGAKPRDGDIALIQVMEDGVAIAPELGGGFISTSPYRARFAPAALDATGGRRLFAHPTERASDAGGDA